MLRRSQLEAPNLHERPARWRARGRVLRGSGAQARTDPTNPEDVLSSGLPIADWHWEGGIFGSIDLGDDIVIGRDLLEPPRAIPRPDELSDQQLAPPDLQVPPPPHSDRRPVFPDLGILVCPQSYRTIDCAAPDLTAQSFADVPSSWDGYVLVQRENPRPAEVWSPCDAGLVARVWGFLQVNLDLVEWALCRGDASPEQVDCVLAAIRGTGPAIELVLAAECGHFGMSTPPAESGGGFGTRVLLCNDPHVLFDPAVFLYCSGDAANAACAVAAIASSLLHELTHTCQAVHPGQGADNPGTPFRFEQYCNVPYLTGAWFAWAAFRRYPEAAAAPCCAQYVDRWFVPQYGTKLPGFPNSRECEGGLDASQAPLLGADAPPDPLGGRP